MEVKSKNYPELYQTYKSIRLYKEKLKFFDEQFGLIPLSFPEFQVDIKSFLEKEKMDQLLDIFEKEKMLSSNLLKKKIEEEETTLLFNITPENSNRQYFNDFILNKFMHEDKNFQFELQKINNNPATEQINDQLINATNKIKSIQEKVKYSKERNYKIQFITVFFNGFTDYQFDNIKQFSYKKRFIELYLYAQGMLHARYIQELKKRSSNFHTALKMMIPLLINSLIGLEDFILDTFASDQCFLLN